MRIGPLKKRVAIRSAATERDSFGQAIATWSTDATVWASIEPLSGRELVSAQQQHAETTHRVRMRYQVNTTVTAAKRLLYDSRVFEIVTVIHSKEGKRMLELLCKEIE